MFKSRGFKNPNLNNKIISKFKRFKTNFEYEQKRNKCICHYYVCIWKKSFIFKWKWTFSKYANNRKSFRLFKTQIFTYPSLTECEIKDKVKTGNRMRTFSVGITTNVKW